MTKQILYTMPGTCALAPNIAVAWFDAPVKIHNLERGEQQQDRYLKINPKGKVPALQFEDGDVLTEAAAILTYLGSQYGGQGYSDEQPLRRREAEALSYLTSEVHATYGPHFAVQKFADSEAAQAEIKARTYDKLAGHYAFLNEMQAASDGDWYLGQRSMADAYLYVVCRWIELTPLSIDDYPILKQHRAKMELDQDVQLALKRQGMEAIG